MRRDVVELRTFYASPLGAAAREMISRKVDQAWGDLKGLDALALGYATPFLDYQFGSARRIVAAMPASQGVEIWPVGGPVLSCLAGETELPFPNALFDRVLMVHALEEAADPLALLREAWRVLAPTGRIIVVAAARGLWSNAEATPFGHGRPYSRRQLESLVRDAELEPTAWSRALYARPLARGPRRGLRAGGRAALATLRRGHPDGGREADLRGEAERPPGPRGGDDPRHRPPRCGRPDGGTARGAWT
jgi:SAM-dependent methyltransferase